MFVCDACATIHGEENRGGASCSICGRFDLCAERPTNNQCVMEPQAGPTKEEEAAIFAEGSYAHAKGDAMELDESDPLYIAIDRGGGQTCDINGVVRELEAAGFAIVKKEPPSYMHSEAKATYRMNISVGRAY
jgi:hypothetical protein